jgi:hypothetical protein
MVAPAAAAAVWRPSRTVTKLLATPERERESEKGKGKRGKGSEG